MKCELRDISYTHPGREENCRPIIRGMNFLVNAGESVGVMGEEGSGKSTLLQLIAGVLEPTDGYLAWDGVDVTHNLVSRSAWRKRIGFQFQLPEQYFFGETIFRELEFAARHGNAAFDENSLKLILDEVGLREPDIMERSPYALSMGEARRLALASLLVRNPDLAILDEPTVGLDADGTATFLRALTGLRTKGRTIIVASHDVDFLNDCVDRVIMLHRGAIAFDGPVADVMTDEDLLRSHGYDLPQALLVLKELGLPPGSQAVRTSAEVQRWYAERKSGEKKL
jgi:energy-coupling factor transporter ATP-binding protein EcfA2